MCVCIVYVCVYVYVCAYVFVCVCICVCVCVYDEPREVNNAYLCDKCKVCVYAFEKENQQRHLRQNSTHTHPYIHTCTPFSHRSQRACGADTFFFDVFFLFFVLVFQQRKSEASKQLTIHTLPNVLVLQLKRFSFLGMHGGKISKHVAFEFELGNCVCVCTYIHAYVYTCIHIYIHMHIRTNIDIYRAWYCV